MKSKVTTLMVSAAVAFTPMSPLVAQASEPSPSDPVAQSWVPATPAEQDAARGGGAPIIALLYIGGTWVIRQCLVRSTACVNGAVATFNGVAAAKKYACKKYRRFC